MIRRTKKGYTGYVRVELSNGWHIEINYDDVIHIKGMSSSNPYTSTTHIHDAMLVRGIGKIPIPEKIMRNVRKMTDRQIQDPLVRLGMLKASVIESQYVEFEEIGR